MHSVSPPLQAPSSRHSLMDEPWSLYPGEHLIAQAALTTLLHVFWMKYPLEGASNGGHCLSVTNNLNVTAENE